jgi:hypothetical protein
MKQYQLGFGCKGNGITVWNSKHEVNGDYETVAHIRSDRSVKIYDLAMPNKELLQIMNFAKTVKDPSIFTESEAV